MGHLGQPRIYPNLNPSAAIPVDRDQVFSLRSFADNYRMNRGKEHGHYVPNSRFTFVTMMSGQTLMHPRFRHPALSEGKPVLYAGEAYFNNGRLEWWSNGSGNYRPDPDHAAQAGFPMEHFYSYGEILKGAHTHSRTGSLHANPLRNRTEVAGHPIGAAQAKLASSPAWPGRFTARG